MPFLRITYQIAASAQEIESRRRRGRGAEREMPVAAIRHPHVLAEIVGQVESITPWERICSMSSFGWPLLPPHVDAAAGVRDVAQLVNMLFGNSSLQESVQLLDVELPPSILNAFSGPRLGIAVWCDCASRGVRSPARPSSRRALHPLIWRRSATLLPWAASILSKTITGWPIKLTHLCRARCLSRCRGAGQPHGIAHLLLPQRGGQPKTGI
ncbi:MAG: hypothetical protein R3A44_41805 [Caldilineaceae bacterium]